MKTIVVCITLWVFSAYAYVLQAQEVKEEKEENTRITLLEEEKSTIVAEEKALLKKAVEAINERLANSEITKEKAQELKESAAAIAALNIQNRIGIVDHKITLLERNGETYKLGESSLTVNILGEDEDKTKVLLDIAINNKKHPKKVIYDKRTYTDFVLAFGLNNAITREQSLKDVDYKIAGSRFFEIGIAWKTRVFKHSNIMRVKYGISYHSNGLKPTDNRYFVARNRQTVLETFPETLDKSKFRMDHLVVPLHIEIGASTKKVSEEKMRYSIQKKFRIGIGGYAGLNLSTRQKLKFVEDGDKVKNKLKRDYNTNDFIYGVSSYLGFGDMSLYAKYDLSPIFENATVDTHNVSLGLRFDL